MSATALQLFQIYDTDQLLVRVSKILLVVLLPNLLLLKFLTKIHSGPKVF